MVVKLFVDLRSQPARSIATFIKTSSIDHELVHVDLLKGEHKDPKYAACLSLGTVPAMDEDGFCLSESVAIFRYLVTTYASKVPEYWYPAEPRVRAKVDEYMSYHPAGLRSKCTDLIQGELIAVFGGGPKPTEEKLAELNKGVDDALDKFEQLFLSEGEFIAGRCTFADLLAVDEITNMILCSKDFLATRPKLSAYVDRVKANLNPTYDENFQFIKTWVASYRSK